MPLRLIVTLLPYIWTLKIWYFYDTCIKIVY